MAGIGGLFDKLTAGLGALFGRASKGGAKLRADASKLQAIAAQVADSQGVARAGLGVGPQKQRADGIDNAQLGVIHEFGTRTIPARPFIRPAFAAHRAGYVKILEAFAKSHVLTGKAPLTQALGIVGLKMAADMKRHVTAGPQVPPPNEEKYAARKAAKGKWKQDGRSKGKRPEGPVQPPRTLVDTGAMVGAISWEVTKGKGKKR